MGECERGVSSNYCVIRSYCLARTNMRPKLLTEANIKTTTLLNVTPCSLVDGAKRSTEPSWLSPQLETETLGFSDMLVPLQQTARRKVPKCLIKIHIRVVLQCNSRLKYVYTISTRTKRRFRENMNLK